MLMKKILFMPLLGLIIMLSVSCSQDDDILQDTQKSEVKKLQEEEKEEAKKLFMTVQELKSMPSDVKEKRKAGLILSKYTTLRNYTYSLDISKEEALKLGVSEKLYDEISEDLRKTNETIREFREQGVDVKMTDVKAEAEKAEKSMNNAETRSGNNGRDQYGTISTNGTEFGSDSFMPEITKTHVLFRCRTAALTPVYTTRVRDN